MKSWRDSFLDACALGALTLVAITELLSAFNALTRSAVLISWLLVLIAVAASFRLTRRTPGILRGPHFAALGPGEWKFFAVYVLIALVTLITAIIAAPNAHDALTYHLPRVVRWIQDRSVAFYPTHATRQLWIGPGYEYFLVNFFLVTGTDAVVNLLQWLAFIANPAIVSLIARELGAERKGQLIAALFALTIPMAICEASGAQVDLFASFWLAASVALLLRIRRVKPSGLTFTTAVLLGSAIGMAVLSKATNALFLTPFIVWIGASVLRERLPRSLALGGIAFIVALGINSGHMLRNRDVFGGVLGPKDSGGVRNEIFGPRVLISNIIRNAALQLPSPSMRVNTMMRHAIERIHGPLGIDVNDPRTTYEFNKFYVPPERDDEGVASNQLHFLIILAVGVWLALRHRRTPTMAFLACVLVGALLFCAILKWQPWHSRLVLPLFVVSGGAVGWALERALKGRALQLMTLALAVTAAPPAFRNILRPLVSRHPVFTVPYEKRLFTDWGRSYEHYSAATDLIASRGCSRIGLIEDPITWEFPVWKMLQRRLHVWPEVRHIDVTNPSRKTATEKDRAFSPCAIVTLYHNIPADKQAIAMKKFFPEGAPKVPPGFVPVFKQGYVTVYVPGAA
jgi:hypothetical protein